jgi:PAS domain S-box-containing protein
MRLRQTLVIAFTLTACILVTAWGILLSQRAFFSCPGRDGAPVDRTVADKVAEALAEKRPAAASKTLRGLDRQTQLVGACVFDRHGELFAYYLRGNEAPPCDSHAAAVLHEGSLPFRRVSEPLVLGGASVGTMTIVSDLDLRHPTETDERLRLFGATVFAITLASVGVAIAVGRQLSGSSARRLAALAQGSETSSETAGHEAGLLRTSPPGGISESLLQPILNRIREAVFLADTQDRVVFANHPALALTHKTIEELKGRNLAEVFRPERRPVGDPADRLWAEGLPAGTTLPAFLIADDNRETPVELISVRTAEGVAVMLRDLAPNDTVGEMLDVISGSAEVAIVRYDLNGVISNWSRGAEETFGYRSDEIAGKPGSTLIVPGDTDPVPQALQQLGRGEPAVNYRGRFCTKTGAAIEMTSTISPLPDRTGKLVGALQIARDLTAGNEAAARIQELTLSLEQCNESLKRSNDDLEWFAFVASHDLQEPLRMIAVNSQFLARDARSQDDQTPLFVRNILDGTRRMRELLTDLMAYTDVGTPGPGAEEAVIDLNLLIRKVQANLKIQIEETGARIAVSQMPVIVATEGHLTSLFQNLLGNALKYRSEDPPCISVTARPTGDMVRFEVADNGIGIDPEYHDRIFVPFKRLHGRNIPGTGIGLAICQRVVQRYGGSIWVESQAGHGATFVFTLPQAAGGGNSKLAGGAG